MRSLNPFFNIVHPLRGKRGSRLSYFAGGVTEKHGVSGLLGLGKLVKVGALPGFPDGTVIHRAIISFAPGNQSNKDKRINICGVNPFFDCARSVMTEQARPRHSLRLSIMGI